jgi:hypothetical protein
MSNCIGYDLRLPKQLYFEHADELAPLLNLRKSKRKAVKGSKKPAVSMVSALCGAAEYS